MVGAGFSIVTSWSNKRRVASEETRPWHQLLEISLVTANRRACCLNPGQRLGFGADVRAFIVCVDQRPRHDRDFVDVAR
jgi:hypothetical protein